MNLNIYRLAGILWTFDVLGKAGTQDVFSDAYDDLAISILDMFDNFTDYDGELPRLTEWCKSNGLANPEEIAVRIYAFVAMQV